MKLFNVTLCTITSDMLDLTARAMRLCQKDIEYGSVKFVSDAVIPSGPWEKKTIYPRLTDLNSYNRYVSQHLPDYCNTDFLLLVQWDGYVLDAGAWDDAFLHYDYIGAVWPWHKENRVGNGGFCLRSKRFMEATASMKYPPQDEFYSDDDHPCRVWRKELEAKGLKFAPESLAEKFAYERSVPQLPTFGFHGQFTFHQHVPDDEMKDMVSKFNARQVHRVDYKELLANYATQGRFGMFKALYERLIALDEGVNIRYYFSQLPEPVYSRILRLCEYYDNRKN